MLSGSSNCNTPKNGFTKTVLYQSKNISQVCRMKHLIRSLPMKWFKLQSIPLLGVPGSSDTCHLHLASLPQFLGTSQIACLVATILRNIKGKHMLQPWESNYQMPIRFRLFQVKFKVAPWCCCHFRA